MFFPQNYQKLPFQTVAFHSCSHICLIALKVSSLPKIKCRNTLLIWFPRVSNDNLKGRHDIQHNDTQRNDIQHNDTQHLGLICDTQRK